MMCLRKRADDKRIAMVIIGSDLHPGWFEVAAIGDI